MTTSRPAIVALMFALGSVVALPRLATAQAEQTLGTLGAGNPGQSSTPGAKAPDTIGPAPRLANGRPDFNGVWDHAYVPDMAATSRNPELQKGPGTLPYAPAGIENIRAYDPETNGDYTGMCMPFGLMRSFNAPYPFQIMQTDKYVTFLFEQNNWFHVVPFRNAHTPMATDNPTWFGESIATWEGDTLVVDTVGFNGFTRLDTKGNPHSDKMHLVMRFTRTDSAHIRFHVTIDDPVYYTAPWTNERTFTMTDGNLIEYSCEENNRALWEGRIKIWTPPSSHPPAVRK